MILFDKFTLTEFNKNHDPKTGRFVSNGSVPEFKVGDTVRSRVTGKLGTVVGVESGEGWSSYEVKFGRSTEKFHSSFYEHPDAANRRSPGLRGQFEEDFSDWARSLTRSEVKGLKSYAGNPDYGRMNENLRNGLIDPAPEIRGLDRAIAKGVLKRDVRVYRALDLTGLDELKVPNTRFTDAGFYSTSIDKKYVTTLAKDMIGYGKPAIFSLKVKAGHHAVYVEAYDRGGDESEMIFPRGTTVKVKSVRVRDGVTMILGEIE